MSGRIRTLLALLGHFSLMACAAHADERVIALVAQSRGTEPADLLVPYAVLASAGRESSGSQRRQVRCGGIPAGD